MLNVNLHEKPKGWCFLQLHTLCQPSRAISDSTSIHFKIKLGFSSCCWLVSFSRCQVKSLSVVEGINIFLKAQNPKLHEQREISVFYGGHFSKCSIFYKLLNISPWGSMRLTVTVICVWRTFKRYLRITEVARKPLDELLSIVQTMCYFRINVSILKCQFKITAIPYHSQWRSATEFPAF